MMYTLNRIQIIGPVGNTPELRETQEGIKVTNFTVCTIDRWRDKATDKIRTRKKWHKVVAWQDLAVRICEFVKEDMVVLVEGSLSYRSSVDSKDPERKINIAEIKASNVTRFSSGSYSSKKNEDESEDNDVEVTVIEESQETE